MTLVSLLQSVPCVYYRSTIGNGGDRRTPDSGYAEERSIGFRVRDATGSMRVFPRGARFDAPVRFDGETGMAGRRAARSRHPAHGVDPAGRDRSRAGGGRAAHGPASPTARARSRGCAIGAAAGPYHESRLEPGDPVTIIGRALPFADLADPARGRPRDRRRTSPPTTRGRGGPRRGARRRARWPTTRPRPGATPRSRASGSGGRSRRRSSIRARTPCRIASADEAARDRRGPSRSRRTTLVLAASDEVPLLIAYGIPGAVVERGQTQFLVGLLGAVLAIASAMVFAIDLSGGFGR